MNVRAHRRDLYDVPPRSLPIPCRVPAVYCAVTFTCVIADAVATIIKAILAATAAGAADAPGIAALLLRLLMQTAAVRCQEVAVAAAFWAACLLACCFRVQIDTFHVRHSLR
jgi:hypothetical protein